MIYSWLRIPETSRNQPESTATTPTGTNLGFFANRSAGPIVSVAAHRDTGQAFTLITYSNVRTWDYSTGTSYGLLVENSGYSQVVTYGSRLFAYNTTRIDELNPTTGAILSTSTAPSGGSLKFVTSVGSTWFAGLSLGSTSKVVKATIGSSV